MAKKSLVKKIFGAKKPERKTTKSNDTQQIFARMAEDINITKLNVIKLVEIQKETPATKAEDFFQRQKEKENAYEEGYRRGSGGASSKSPTRAGMVERGANSNPFDFLKFLFNGLIKAGLFTGLGFGLLKILEDPENRKSISDFLRNFFVGFLNLVKLGAETLTEIFTGDDGRIKEGIIQAFVAIKDLIVTAIGKLAETLSDPRIWEGIYDVIKSIGQAIYKILSTEIEIEGEKLSLGTVVAGLVVAMAGLKAAALAASGALFGMGMGGGKGGVLGKILGVLGIIAAGMGLKSVYDRYVSSGNEDGLAVGGGPKEDITQMSMVDKGLVAAGTTAGVVTGVKGTKKLIDAAKKTGEVILDVRTQSVGQLAKSAPKSMWGKFLAFVAKKSPGLFGKIGVKLAQATTLAAIPIGGWIMAAIQLGFTFWTAWELYELWREYNNASDDESTTPTKVDPKEELAKQQQAMQNAAVIYGTLYQNKDKVKPADLEAARVKYEQEKTKYEGMKTGAAAGSTSPAPAAPAGSTTPSQIQDSSMGIDYAAYASRLGMRESGGRYDNVNSLGFLGKYQFGAMALEDLGLVKPGVGKKGERALDDPNNWRLPGGKQAFLKDAGLQEEAMLRYTKSNYAELKRLKVISNNSSSEQIAGYLAAAHLAGPGGAKNLSVGADSADAYGTKTSSYFKLGSATQTGVPGVEPSIPPMAAAPAPSIPPIAAAPVASVPQKTNTLTALGLDVGGSKDNMMFEAIQNLASIMTGQGSVTNIVNNSIDGGSDTNTRSSAVFDQDIMKLILNQMS